MKLRTGVVLCLVLCAVPCWSAVTIDATASGDSSSASTSITTQTFSTTAGNELLLAFVSTDAKSAGVSVTSISGGGLTWVLVKRTNAQLGTAEIWRAFAASQLSSVSVSAKLSQSVAASITVVSFTGVDTTGTDGSGAIGATASASASSGAPTGSVVTTRAGSWVFGVGDDWDNAIDRTPGSGQTIVHQYLASVGDTYWVQRQNSVTPTSGTTVTINDTAPTGDRYNLTLCEVLPPSGSGSTFTVSGTITPASAAEGTTVTLSSSGTTVGTATADSSGNYSFSSIANGSYTVTPSKTGFTFSPASQPVTVNGANATAPAFAVLFSLSGAITGTSGSTVTLSQNGTTVASATANSSGNYSFGGLANGTYVVTPSQSGFTFSPVNQMVVINNANATAAGFTGTASQSSAIKLVQSNVNLNQTAGSALTVSFSSANTQGNFLIVTGTATNPSTTLTVSDTQGNSYLPAIGPVTDSTQGVTAYIWYVPSCKAGTNAVTLTPGTSAAMEVHISEWSGLAITSPLDQAASATGSGTTASSGSMTTTANGELVFGYSFMANAATPGAGFAGISLFNGDLDEYQVQPSAGAVATTFSQASGTWFALMATFLPAVPPPTTWSIKGTITPTSGGSGATVNLTGSATASVTADTSGNYTFSSLNNGTYTVTPSNPGYSFSPPSQSVTVSGANVTGVNFTAQPNGTVNLAIDAKTSTDNSSETSTVATSPFSTTSGNELLLAFIATDYLHGANTTVTGVSGAGLTWGLVLRTNTQSGTAEIWRAFSVGTLSNVTVTATLSQSVESSMTVMSFAGADTTGTNGSGAIGATASTNADPGAPSATLLTTRSNSWVFGVGNDFDNAIARTPGPGQTVVHQDLTSLGDTYWVQMQNSTTPVSGTSVSINDTAPTKDRYNLSIVEVLPALSGGGGSPPTVSMMAPVPNATVSGKTNVQASASDQVGIASVQFLLDSSNLGSPVTSAPYAMTWDTTTATAGSHTLAAVARNVGGLSTTSTPITVNVDNSGNTAVVGSWSSPVTIPTVAVNLILLYNNKLLFYEDGASPTVWDYVNNVFTNISTNADLFCSGHAALSDGRILAVGGYGGSSTEIGIPNAEIFDPSSNRWTIVPSMKYSRWYPTATTLSDGTVLVTAGWQTTNHTNAGIPEIYNPSTNQWTQLTAANNPFETYPFIYLLPDGRVLHVGNSEVASDTDALDLTTQTWTVIDSRIIDGGSPAMYLPDKFVKAGSASDSQESGPSSNTTFVLDMTQSSPAWQETASMAYPRSFMNLVTLPDDTVLAVGGETDKNGGNINNAVYAAELWSPQTQTWSTMASMHTPREYHSTALLLPDGRVVSSGMGADFGNVPNEMSAEFYSPPYLFKGARPTITQAPSLINYGQAFTVTTPDAASITTAVLIRLGAVTHFFDQNTRYVPLTFSQTSGGLSLTAPANGALAPPGYYMLFLVNSSGVPSVAPIVQLLP